MAGFHFNPEITIADVATALIAFLALVVTLWQLIISRNTFSSTIRPFLGVDAIEGRIESAQSNFAVLASIKNFGQIPAKNVHILMKVFIDHDLVGKDIPVEQAKSTLFPGLTTIQVYALQPYYQKILNGALLQVFINVNYDGVTTDHYSTNYEFQYYRESKVFLPITSQWSWNKFRFSAAARCR